MAFSTHKMEATPAGCLAEAQSSWYRHGSARYFRIGCMRKSRDEIASKTFEFHSAISPPRAPYYEKKSGKERKVELKTTLSECE